ncbi:MAG: penicillin-binding protein 2 [Candidatus Kerfeldbacteria bacterium]|nr:penicillin-binding protein 2 [Candidatus Kerfeldbacteria bacterium]
MARTWRPPASRWWQDRLGYLRFGFAIFGAVLIWRLFTLQVLQHGFYVALADDQHQFSQQLDPERGEILVRDRQSATGYYPLATNRTLHLLYAVPKQIRNPTATASALAPYVTIPEADLLKRLAKPNDLYEPIQHYLTDDQQQTIAVLKLPGLYFSDESTRYYPERTTGSQLIGFVGFDHDRRVGRYGLEGSFETELGGRRGQITAEKDASGQLIATAAQFWSPAQDGADLILTIDRTIEFEACRRLNEAVLKHGADSGSLVIMDPTTGAIYALCGSPDFDPNSYNTVTDLERFTNSVTQEPYEPGSVFKPVTMAAAINEEAVTPETTYTDTGQVQVGSYTIKNSDGKAHGAQTMTAVLEESLNTGAIFAMNQIGPEKFQRYVTAFGFGQPTGIEVDERPGNVATLATGREIYATTASFGQGVTVTPLQLAAAFSVFANGGQLVRPYVVEKIRHSDGREVVSQPRVVRQVISPKTAATISAMLVRVVQNGHGQRAGVPGYFVAGKTGTAQIPDPATGTYHSDQTIGTFAGFAPVDDPKFVMVVKLVRPRDVQFAESSAAPLFGELARFLLSYFGVPPTESPNP